MAVKIGKNFDMDLLEAIIAPTKTYPGSSVSYTGDIWSVVDRAGNASYIKCVYMPSGVNGVMNVHFKDDFNSSNTKQYASLPLSASTVVPGLIDEIKQTGTSISLTNVLFGLIGTQNS